MDASSGKLAGASKLFKCPIPRYQIPLLRRSSVSLSANQLTAAGIISAHQNGKANELLQVTRATVHLSNPAQLAFLNSLAGSQAYDIVSVTPVDERTWLSLVSQGEFDILSLDLSSGRLPFALRRHQLLQLIRRNIYFEIRFAEALQDASSRRHLFTNVQQLIRFVPHDRIILSSGASHPLALRAPYDVINLAQLMGVTGGAKQVVTTNVVGSLYKGAARRTAGGSVGVLVPAVPPTA